MMSDDLMTGRSITTVTTFFPCVFACCLEASVCFLASVFFAEGFIIAWTRFGLSIGTEGIVLFWRVPFEFAQGVWHASVGLSVFIGCCVFYCTYGSVRLQVQVQVTVIIYLGSAREMLV
jgi:hypothetical protein